MADWPIATVLVTQVCTLVTVALQYWHTRRAGRSARMVERRERQLAEFYGPLDELFERALLLRELFGEALATDPASAARLFASHIRPLNDHIATIITTRRHLVDARDGGAPFDQFLRHGVSLELFFDQDPGPSSHLPFPHDLPLIVKDTKEYLRMRCEMDLHGVSEHHLEQSARAIRELRSRRTGLR